MAERKAQQKYYPPEFDWRIHGTINGFNKSKPSRHVAQKTENDGSGCSKIRFELPFNIWCEGCKAHIGMGKRYNAMKKKIGMYYSTPVLQFDMKCHMCPNMIIIVTDPKNTEYQIIAGAQKRVDTYDPTDIGLIELQSETKTQKLATDAFYRLEHEVTDVQKSVDSRHSITRLQEYNDRFTKEYPTNTGPIHDFAERAQKVQDREEGRTQGRGRVTGCK
jgi:coiled-coil domain-containing protein 130